MKIGLVMAGGLAKGASQFGFVKGFFEIIPRDSIKIISASSIGAINALGVSYDKLGYLDEMYNSQDFNKLKDLKKVLKNSFVRDVVDKLIEDSYPKIPVYISLACINKLSVHYYKIDETTPKEDVHKISDITIHNPFVYGLAKRYNHNFYTDGGTFDNVPTFPLRYEKDLDLILIVHSTNNYVPPRDLYEGSCSVLDVFTPAFCERNIGGLSFKHDDLVEMAQSGYKIGRYVAEELKKCKNKEELDKKTKEITNFLEDKKQPNVLTLVETLNRIFQSRRLK